MNFEKDRFNGINLPLASLRSINSCGVGEFYDLIPMIDWVKEINMDIIQLLPINDTGYDSSPYNALSSIALHPIYISLHALEQLSDHPNLQEKLTEFIPYNKEQRVQYDDVLRMKMDFLRLYYSQTKVLYQSDESFIAYKNKYPWIKRYALFKTLKETQNLSSWKKWPDELKNPSPTTVKELYELHDDEIEFHFFVQYICYNQLLIVKRHAHSKGVMIMGDIPILISPESVDVWFYRRFFNMKYAAGAPPDEFNKDGQYWGFPIYDWKELKADNYRWWDRRLKYAENFYDIFRIDHVIGFYRIWAIPPRQLAIKGEFIPSDEKKFTKLGHCSLKALLKFTHMHPIGEDLGSMPTPASVSKSLDTLGIDRTIVVRWEIFKTTGEFIPYDKYKKGSYCTLSTHDSETLTQWFRDFPDEAKAFCKAFDMPYKKKLTKTMREKILTDAHHTNSRFHINLLQEYLALFPKLVWECPDDERINRPGMVLPTNWTYRLRPTVEEIVTSKTLKKMMKKIIE
ncbi:MAG: 4-alpha-glucanotransferase [Rhabdochlamydiaceae bacterium]|nr:4-alpha-glucanotransferase [Candidatus Amphrikana amoebophyrae]